VIRHISSGSYFVSEKRTQNFAGEIFFSGFSGVHMYGIRFGTIKIHHNRLNAIYNRLNT